MNSLISRFIMHAEINLQLFGVLLNLFFYPQNACKNPSNKWYISLTTFIELFHNRKTIGFSIKLQHNSFLPAIFRLRKCESTQLMLYLQYQVQLVSNRCFHTHKRWLDKMIKNKVALKAVPCHPLKAFTLPLLHPEIM